MGVAAGAGAVPEHLDPGAEIVRGRPGLFALVALLAVLSAAPAHARDASVIESRRAKADFALRNSTAK